MSCHCRRSFLGGLVHSILTTFAWTIVLAVFLVCLLFLLPAIIFIAVLSPPEFESTVEYAFSSGAAWAGSAIFWLMTAGIVHLLRKPGSTPKATAAIFAGVLALAVLIAGLAARHNTVSQPTRVVSSATVQVPELPLPVSDLEAPPTRYDSRAMSFTPEPQPEAPQSGSGTETPPTHSEDPPDTDSRREMLRAIGLTARQAYAVFGKYLREEQEPNSGLPLFVCIKGKYIVALTFCEQIICLAAYTTRDES